MQQDRIANACTNQMRPSVVTALEKYWHNLRGASLAIPLRNAVDPRVLRSALPYIFLLDVSAPSNARFSIVGSALTDFWQADLGHELFNSLFGDDAKHQLTALIQDLVAMPACAKLDLHWQTENFTTERSRMTLLPLRSDRGQIHRLIGALELTAAMPTRVDNQKLALSGSLVKPLGSGQALPIQQKGPHLTLISNNYSPPKGRKGPKASLRLAYG